jgi:hypothetical protein
LEVENDSKINNSAQDFFIVTFSKFIRSDDREDEVAKIRSFLPTYFEFHKFIRSDDREEEVAKLQSFLPTYFEFFVLDIESFFHFLWPFPFLNL